jgi:hypothetical protein
MAIEMPNRDHALTVVMDEPVSAPREEHMALFPEHDIAVFRERWHDLQSSFVDEPRNAVEPANELVGKMVSRLTEIFANLRNTLEADWGKGKDVSTKDPRQALRRYRSFFDRLLSV